jgi:hypothetical protein
VFFVAEAERTSADAYDTGRSTADYLDPGAGSQAQFFEATNVL